MCSLSMTCRRNRAITGLANGPLLAAMSVAIDSAPFRGVLPLPLSALRSARTVIGNLANYRRAVMLTYEQFRYSFANAVSENEARRLHEAYPVRGSGIPLFQATTANINPLTETKVCRKSSIRKRSLRPARLRAGTKVACRQLDSRMTLPPGMVNRSSSACLPATATASSAATNRGIGAVRD